MVGRVEQLVLRRDAIVVFAEGRRYMDQAGAVLGGDEVAGDHREGAGLAIGEGEHRALVAAADQFAAWEAVGDLHALAEHLLHQGLGKDQRLAVDTRLDVGDVRRHRDRLVARQGPGRRRPDEQRLPRLAALAGEQREADIYGGVGDVLVAERHLVRGERGAAARAVGHDLVPLVEAALVPELAQRPPDRLDVVVLERDVGVVEVDPEADPLGQPVPLLDVLEHRGAAALVELGDPVLLDLLLGGDTQLFFDLELDRQAVAVPAGLARHPVAAHRPVARVDVLEDSGEDVVGAGTAVRRRRPLVEAPDLGSLAVGERAVEDVALAPARQYALLELGKGLLRVDLFEPWHERVILGVSTLHAACPPTT